MKTVEKTGKTVEEAVEEALKELDVDRNQVEVEIIEGGNKGLFGILGGKQARVRVVVREQEQSGEEQYQSRGQEDQFKGQQDQSTNLQEQPQEESEESVDRAEEARSFLEKLLEAMNVKAEVKTVAAGAGEVSLEITGSDLGVVIGRRGQTLDSIQYLVGLVINKGSQEWTRVLIDAQGYRKRREETLRSLAGRMARKAKAGGRKVVLEPMSSQERRIIHLVLQDDPDVTTYSEGEEPFRRVVIAPR